MRLLTHNMIQCNVNSKTCPTGSKYPLKLNVDDWETMPVDYNQEFLQETLFSKVNWSALMATCKSLNWPLLKSLTEQKDDDEEEKGMADIEEGPEPGSDAWWHLLHDILLQRNIKEGYMKCSGCEHIFPIKASIPNMLLSNEEI
jgi:multifunctional methyltransferase subunit TRM112